MIDKYKIFEEKVGMTFETWYKNNYNIYVRAAWTYVKKDIHDIVTDSMLLTLKYINNYDPSKSNIKTYAWTIVKNNIIRVHHIKVKKNEFFYQDFENDENKNNNFTYQIPYNSDEYEIEREEEIQKNYKIMINCIEKLPEKYAEILKAREIRGLEYQEIVEELGINLSIVKNRIKEARKLVIKKYNCEKTKYKK